MNPTKLSVFNLVGGSFCVESNDGDLVFNAIKKTLDADQTVEVSFQNVNMLTSAFLNTAIGKLYREFSEEKIRALVKVSGLQNADVTLLRRVIETAKLYYKNPEWLEASVKNILGEGQ